MTAIVGILNKRGIAIAADSASTTQKKIINSGNKMLRMSDIIPAAVMIVNHSLIAGIPWEVIIRWYRKENGKTKFDTLQACIDDFLGFVNYKALNRDDVGDETCYFDEERNPDNIDITTHLVFAGYGAKDSMPSICELCIYGIDNHKIMYKKSEGYIVSDKEATIYAQGQKDIIRSYIHGVIDDHIEKLINGHINILNESFLPLLCEYSPQEALQSDDLISLPPYFIIREKMESIINKCKEESEKEWLEAIKGYNHQEMASLAENLIKATEIHKKIIGDAEEVGGLIDLAIITKNDGFQWLNRKSWYEPSRGGQYGKFGI